MRTNTNARFLRLLCVALFSINVFVKSGGSPRTRGGLVAPQNPNPMGLIVTPPCNCCTACLKPRETQAVPFTAGRSRSPGLGLPRETVWAWE